MRTLWLLHEIGADFNVVVHPFDKTLRSPEYLAVNPAGRVPALEIDGRTIWESGAIAEVLCNRYPASGLGRFPDDPDWADWLVWLHFAESISQHAAALTQQHIVLYEDKMRSPIIMQIEARRLEKCFGAVDNRLKDREYLLDSGFSAADIGVAQAIYLARHFARIEPFVQLEAWYLRVTSRPAFEASLPPPGATRLYPLQFYPPWETSRDG